MNPRTSGKLFNDSGAIFEAQWQACVIAVTRPLVAPLTVGPFGLAAAPSLPSGASLSGPSGSTTLTLAAGFSGACAIPSCFGLSYTTLTLGSAADSGKVWACAHCNQG